LQVVLMLALNKEHEHHKVTRATLLATETADETLTLGPCTRSSRCPRSLPLSR
jgi:hypothetical protein